MISVIISEDVGLFCIKEFIVLRKYIFVGIGGGIGAILRFIIKDIYSDQYQGVFPFDTLLINTLGCFLLAVIMSIALEVLKMNSNFRLGIATGVLGAFTTFSAICKEASSLTFQGLYFVALLYAVSTLVLGFLAVYFGITLSRGIIRARTRRRESEFARNSANKSEERS
jgi:CrcB protein